MQTKKLTPEEIKAMEEKLGAVFVRSYGVKYMPDYFRKGEGEGEQYFDMDGNEVASPWDIVRFGMDPTPMPEETPVVEDVPNGTPEPTSDG